MTTATAENEALTPEAVHHAEMFNKHFTEFYFSVHMLGGDRKLADITPTFRGQVVEEGLVSGGQAKIIPPDFHNRVERATAKLRRIVHARCLPGEGKGYYFVRAELAEEFVAEFNDALDAFNAAADAIRDAHAEILAYNRERWRPKMRDDADYEAQIGRMIPATPEALRGYYWVEYRLRDPGDARPGVKYRTGAVRDWFAAAHREAVEHAYESRRDRIREPIDRLRKALSAFKSQLLTGDKFNRKSFGAFEDALALFRTCADILAPDLVTTIDEIATEMIGLKEAAGASKLGFAATVKGRKADLSSLIDRVVRECEAATSEVVLSDRLGRPLRALRTGDIEEELPLGA